MLPQPKPLPSAQPQTGTTDRNKQRGTGFTNLNKVLGANQGAGQKMGQAIGSNLSNQAGQVKQNIQQGQSQFQAGAQESTQKANNTIQQGAQLQQAAGETPEAYAARLAQANSADLTKQGQDLQGAAYTGPRGLENAGQIQSRASTVNALGRLAGNSAGQGQLLRSQVAQSGNYTQGQNALDQLLLGKEGQNAIQKGRQATTGINQQAQNSVQNAQTQAAAQDAAINANKSKVLQGLQNQLSGTGEDGVKGFTQQAKEQAAQYNQNATRLQQLLSGKGADGASINPASITDADRELLNNMDQYGLNADSNIYGKNQDEYNNFLSQMGSNVDISQNARYMGDQGVAAQNLAKFLGDTGTANQVSNANFNNKVFNAGSQEEALARNTALQQGDESSRNRLNQLAQMKSQYDQLYNLSGGGTKVKFPHLQGARDRANQILKEMQAMGADPNQSAASYASQANALSGQSKNLKQLALEKYGKK